MNVNIGMSILLYSLIHNLHTLHTLVQVVQNGRNHTCVFWDFAEDGLLLIFALSTDEV